MTKIARSTDAQPRDLLYPLLRLRGAGVRNLTLIIPALAMACGEPDVEPAPPGLIDAGVSVLEDAGAPPEDTGPPPGCDQDGDGFLAEHCGGDDCDDHARGRNPNATERCSFEDENCSGVNNEHLDCTFFAHGREDLYRVDPFMQRVHNAGRLLTPAGRGILDIDIDPNGVLVGVTREELLSFNDQGSYEVVASIDTPPNTNGLAIDSSGRIFLTQSDNQVSNAYTVNLAGEVSVLGNLAPYRSSGDCVVLKDESLLMTAPGEPGEGDLLVYVNSQDATTNSLGSIGFEKVYGLSASFGFLFGATDEGRVLLIDQTTGTGEELFRRADLQFWGAANGD